MKHYLLNGCYSVRIRRNSALDEVSDLSEGCLFDRWACEGTSVTRERVEPYFPAFPTGRLLIRGVSLWLGEIQSESLGPLGKGIREWVQTCKGVAVGMYYFVSTFHL